MAPASFKLISGCFAMNVAISRRVLPLSPAFLHVSFPAVPARRSAVEEVVALLARNLEAHETEAFSRDNGLLTFAADDYGFEFHSSPPPLALPNSTPHCVALSDPHETLSRQVRQGPAHAKSTSSRSEEHTSELQSLTNLVCRLLLEKKKKY